MRGFKSLLWATLVAFMSLTASAAAADTIRSGCYEWTLSYSGVHPWALSETPAIGPTELYLWFEVGLVEEGMTLAEFDFEVSGYDPLGFTPMNGFVNLGGATHLLLVAASCPFGPVVAGRLTVDDSTGAGGSVCLAASAGNSEVVTMDCNSIAPQAHASEVRGASSSVAAPCRINVSCNLPVEPVSWGSVKASYR